MESILGVSIFFVSFGFFLNFLFWINDNLTENIFYQEERNQLYFAEIYLRRDLKEAVDFRRSRRDKLLIEKYDKDKNVEYSISKDAFAENNLYRIPSRTLYRKGGNNRREPLTQFFTGFKFHIYEINGKKLVEIELASGQEKKRIVEIIKK